MGIDKIKFLEKVFKRKVSCFGGLFCGNEGMKCKYRKACREIRKIRWEKINEIIRKKADED